MTGPRRGWGLATAAILLSVSFGAGPPSSSAEDADGSGGDACVYEPVAGVGPACPVPGGLQVLHSDGTVGLIHGLDPVPAGASSGPLPELPLSAPSAVPPICATDLVTQYHHVVIYARATDDADRYATMAATVRTLVEQANGLLRAEANEFGHDADYRMECSGGQLVVHNEALPTARAQATFSTIVGDLQARGYTKTNAKYWVWYDDTGACSCGGMGHWSGDDRATADNANNLGPDFGVTFGYSDYGIMMHENGHNMGAVANAAPDSSGAAHCNDGADIMCYADGGPTSAYQSNVCTDHEHFDCGHDSYFHPAPGPGSWLATHWNLASALNRFLVVATVNQAPTMQSLTCTPSPSNPGLAVTCSFRATDDSAGVAYTVTWGDGSPTARVPATGTVPPGTTRTAAHTWGATGTFTVSVTAADDETPARTSAPRTATHQVVVNTAPAMASVSCAPNPGFTRTGLGCQFRATDDSADVFYMVDWGDGSPAQRVPFAGGAVPGNTVSFGHTWTQPGTYTVTASATDTGAPALSSGTLAFVERIDPAPCSWQRSGTLVAGLGGAEVEGVSVRVVSGLTDACWDHPFLLSGPDGADFNVCFEGGGQRLVCATALGNDAGTVPAGATQVRIVLFAGAQAAWTLALGP